MSAWTRNHVPRKYVLSLGKKQGKGHNLRNTLVRAETARATRPSVPGNASPTPLSKDIYLRSGISRTREIRFSQVGLAITVIATVLLFRELIGDIAGGVSTTHPFRLAEQAVFGLIALCVIYGNVVYQCTRIGYMRRLQSHVPATPGQLDRFFLKKAPTLTILIPSYKEDPEVVRRTLLSAVLQQYPEKRVALLIDDPPDPRQGRDRFLRESAQELPLEIQRLMDGAAREFGALLQGFLDRQRAAPLDVSRESRALASAHAAAARWFEQQAAAHRGEGHSDVLFVQQMFLESSREHLARAKDLEEAAREGKSYLAEWELLADYRRLAARFRVTVTSFQRKKYVNLSHEANKAMNLNSYIGLLGGQYKETTAGADCLLEPCTAEAATLDIPCSDYIITLDADSILAPDYAVRLIEFAERPANRRVAVVQTPYSAEPNPPGLVERIAGATTDMQYLIHQGFTHFNATFWVGANALLRTAALKDICVVGEERGFPVQRFIQDRTVIEDTESSVDLATKGWTLYNYPERLSHSATPPDFGSLLIQRGRWANGGLIIVPKLIRHLLRGRFLARIPEGFFRLHYLVSIALVNIAVPVMLICPFERSLHNLWFPLTCLPYYFLYGRDLMQAGYQAGDLFRVYAMNLMLVPVNLSGVLKSVWQAVTSEKSPFLRTPKIAGRTTAPAAYILVIYGMAVYCFVGFVFDAMALRLAHAAFGLINGLFLGYAIKRFIGFRESWEDISARFFGWRKSLPATSVLRVRFPARGIPPAGADH